MISPKPKEPRIVSLLISMVKSLNGQLTKQKKKNNAMLALFRKEILKKSEKIKLNSIEFEQLLALFTQKRNQCIDLEQKNDKMLEDKKSLLIDLQQKNQLLKELGTQIQKRKAIIKKNQKTIEALSKGSSEKKRDDSIHERTEDWITKQEMSIQVNLFENMDAKMNQIQKQNSKLKISLNSLERKYMEQVEENQFLKKEVKKLQEKVRELEEENLNLKVNYLQSEDQRMKKLNRTIRKQLSNHSDSDSQSLDSGRNQILSEDLMEQMKSLTEKYQNLEKVNAQLLKQQNSQMARISTDQSEENSRPQSYNQSEQSNSASNNYLQFSGKTNYHILEASNTKALEEKVNSKHSVPPSIDYFFSKDFEAELYEKINNFEYEKSILRKLNSSKFITNEIVKMKFIFFYTCLLEQYFSSYFRSEIGDQIILEQKISLSEISNSEMNQILFKSSQSTNPCEELNKLKKYSEQLNLSQESLVSEKRKKNSFFISSLYDYKINSMRSPTPTPPLPQPHLTQSQHLKFKQFLLIEQILNGKELKGLGKQRMKGVMENKVGKMIYFLHEENEAMKKCINEMMKNEQIIVKKNNEIYFQQKDQEEEEEERRRNSYLESKENLSREKEDLRQKKEENCRLM